jgi:monoterpene epsilon-lactone hydrolase
MRARPEERWMPSSEAQREIDNMLAARAAAARLPKPSVEQSRKGWEDASREAPLVEGARFTSADAGGVAAEWMTVGGADNGPVILFLHGGGYNAGSPITHRKLAANLAKATGRRVLMPAYRLAPEHPYPAGPDDAIAAWRWLTGPGGFAPAQVVVAGDSAGGGLALTMMLLLREAGEALPGAAVLLSPWTDLTVSSPSYSAVGDRDPNITQEDLREAGLMYAGDRDPADPMLSPLFADLRGLPPMLIHVGEIEVMLDDSRLFAERARAAGVDVTYKMWPGLWHCFQHAAPEVPEAKQAIDEIAAFIEAKA